MKDDGLVKLCPLCKGALVYPGWPRPAQASWGKQRLANFIQSSDSRCPQ